MKLSVHSMAVLFFTVRISRADVCPPEQSVSVCCMGLAPYNTMVSTWGGIFGYYPTNTSLELDGARCSVNTGTFASW